MSKYARLARGRMQPDFVFSGGSTEIDLDGTGGRAARNKLLKVELAEPGMVAVQLSAQRLNDVLSRSRPQAVVTWQVGSGLHEATVDIGIGQSNQSFVVSAAEVVEVTAQMSTEARIGSGEADFTTSSSYRIFGTAGPATALAPHPATFTQEITVPAGGLASTAVSIPGWAKCFWLLPDDADSSQIVNTVITWRDPTGALNIRSELWQNEQPLRVSGDVSQFVLSTAAGLASYNATILWELGL